MQYFKLSWTEATSLSLWEIHAMEEHIIDTEKQRKNRERLS